MMGQEDDEFIHFEWNCARKVSKHNIRLETKRKIAWYLFPLTKTILNKQAKTFKWKTIQHTNETPYKSS